MAVLPIVKDPAGILRKKAKPVTKVNAAIKKLLDDMVETMREAPGVGLAGPQVGVARRLIVVEYEEDLFQLVNPEITRSEGWVHGTEGCLSIPGYIGDVWRFEKVQVMALDKSGNKVWIDAEGWLARIFQHEIDHLEGLLYTDKCTNFREAKPGDEESEGEESEGEEAEGEESATAEPAPTGGPAAKGE